MWKHTDEDLEAIALEKADRIRDESLPDWFYHGGENPDTIDLSTLEAENACLDPDREAKINALHSYSEESDQLDQVALTLWNKTLASPPISDNLTAMPSTVENYLPSFDGNQIPKNSSPQASHQLIPKTSSLPADIPDNTADEATKRLQPYDVAQELMGRETILISRNAVYFFDGRIYRLMTKEDMQRLIVDRCRDAVASSGTATFIENVYKYIFLEPRINTRDFDPSPDEVVFLDGVLDLNTMRLHRHTPNTISTRLVQANFTKGTNLPCPNFDHFVQRIAMGDAELEHRIWQALGYLLVQDQRGKCFILLQGVRDSGKSVFGRLVQSFFDPETISALDLHSLDGEFSKSDLIAKSLWLDLDLPSGALRGHATSELKKITGGDILSANIKYMPRAAFVNRAKILFATNHPVLTDTTDEAFERRMIVIPFARTIPRDEQDFNLDSKLEREKDAIAAKAIRHFLDLRANKYIFAGNYSANCTISPGEDLISKICLFLTDFCTEADEWTPTETLYSAFSSIFGPICNKKTFSERLYLCSPSIYPDIVRKRDRIDSKGNPLYGYKGIRLK